MIVIGGVWRVVKKREPQTRQLEHILWVFDWNMTKIDGPGSQEQASIVKQFRAAGLSDLKFIAPILYRMSGSASGDPREGILLYAFDPQNPDNARALAAKAVP